MSKLRRTIACTAGLLAGSAFASFDADTLAFYPFADYANGTDITALSTKTFTNAVDESQYLITAEAFQYWGLKNGGSFLLATNDVPGKYLVDWSGYSEEEPIAKLYQTAYLHARPDSKAGHSVKLTLPGLASELSKHDEWTIECFVKVPSSSDFASWPVLISVDAGLTYGDSAAPIKVVPTAETYTDSGLWRVQVGSTYPISGVGAAYNKGWMHIALVCTATTLKYYVNYTQIGNTVTIAHAGENTGKDLVINPGPSWSGFVSGLRVKKAALSTDQMLHAAEYPTGQPTTVFHWALEGTAGEVPVEDYLTAVPYSTDNYPVLSNRRAVEISADGEVLHTSRMAVTLSGVPKTGSDIFGARNYLKLAKGTLPTVTSFTMECFLKFDYTTWNEKYASGENRAWAGVFHQEWEGSNNRHVWALQFRKSGGNFYPYLNGYYDDWTGFIFEDVTDFKTPITLDNKWHHYAVTYDHTARVFEVFEDGVSLGRMTLSKALKSDTGDDLWVGGAASTQPFEGQIDEVRYSRKVLAPSEFLCAEKIKSSFLLLFR